jgi:hypothetical protein
MISLPYTDNKKWNNGVYYTDFRVCTLNECKRRIELNGLNTENRFITNERRKYHGVQTDLHIPIPAI